MRSIFLISLLFVLYIMSTNAFAEQPVANEYRKIFQSGTFFIEYKDDNESKVLAEFNNKRMERTSYLKMNWSVYLNPLGALFGGSGSKYPEVLHQNGKYYQFIDEDIAIVLPENKIKNENLDPRQGWNLVNRKLAIPYELLVFYWNDPYFEKSNSMSPPRFVKSTKNNINNKNYDCDEYVSEIKSLNNEKIQLKYKMIYDENKLIEASSSILRAGIEYPINKIKIKKISGEIPKDAFKISKRTKVYSAGVGDIYDLTAQLVQVESLEGFK